MLGLNKDSVKVFPYENAWAKEFEKEQKILKKLLTGFDIKIEHVGSTSIPGLSAKPIIDIAIGTKNENDLFLVAKKLEFERYDILDSFKEKGEILARKGSPECRTHYIHIELIGSEYWNEFIYFKQYLLDHPKCVKKYQRLKEKLSKKYAKDRKQYTASKNKFISKVLKKAYKLYNFN